MLYEGAIKFIKLAIVAVEKNDIAARGTNIGRAYDIVLELNNTLNHEVGGEISKSLEQLYMFVTDQLTKGNIHSDKKALEDALGVMQTLHTGWQEAIEKLKREDSPQR